jgi:hypothetical protein
MKSMDMFSHGLVGNGITLYIPWFSLLGLLVQHKIQPLHVYRQSVLVIDGKIRVCINGEIGTT